MKITVVGTSNSVMGNKGYIEALRLEHEVIQLSTGRTPFYASMKKIMAYKEEIENGDLLIIDHYVNDVHFYGDRLGESYREHLELFYHYLSSLNVNILNLMFPIQKLEKRSSIDLYHKTKWLCEYHSIAVLDLNELNIPNYFYKDCTHLNHDVSYALGLSLNNGLLKHSFEDVSFGNISQFPFYSLNLDDFSNDKNKVNFFKNSLISIKYLELKHELIVHLSKRHKLIALGLLRDEKVYGCSGFSLNGKKYGINGHGYFLETIEQDVKGEFVISPLSGETEIKNMMGRGVSKGEFTYCYIVDFLLFDSDVDIRFTPANRINYKINIDSFVPLADKILSMVKLSRILPKSVNRLRDIALFLDKEDLTISRDLMHLAHLLRPEGLLIKKKLGEYEKALSELSKANMEC